MLSSANLQAKESSDQINMTWFKAYDSNDQISLNQVYDEKIHQKPFIDSKGKLTNSTDKEGYNILHWAILCNQPIEHIESIIAQGVSVKQENKHGNTPLNLACRYYKNLELVNALLNKLKESDVNSVNNHDETPLLGACHLGDVKIIKALLDKGAKINGLGSSDKIPLQYAIRYGKHDAVQLLLERGADVSVLYDGYKSLIQYAVECDQLEIAHILAIALISKTIQQLTSTSEFSLSFFSLNKAASKAETLAAANDLLRSIQCHTYSFDENKHQLALKNEILEKTYLTLKNVYVFNSLSSKSDLLNSSRESAVDFHNQL